MAYRIDNSSATPSKPTRGAVGPQPDAYFQDQITGGTIVPADFLNMIQDEVAYLVEQAGLTLNKTDDTQIHEAIGLICDTEYISLTGGTVALSQSSDGTYTYNIADFTGTGLVTSEIRSLHLTMTANPATGTAESFEVEYPDGSTKTYQFDYDDANAFSTVPLTVPINKSQSSFTIIIAGGTASFEIFGATQRTFA